MTRAHRRAMKRASILLEAIEPRVLFASLANVGAGIGGNLNISA